MSEIGLDVLGLIPEYEVVLLLAGELASAADDDMTPWG